jgi:alpha-ketoglutarate-dependent taurine dioxygenase
MEKTDGGKSVMQFRTDAPILETDVLQPVVTRHPRTGRLGIFVSPTFTTHIDGMRQEESAALLRFLYAWVARPEFCTRVSWKPNQVVMWDNRSLSHKGIADDVSERRVVHRVSIRGTAPVNHRGETFSSTKVPAGKAALFDFYDQLDQSRKPFSYSNGVQAAM